MNLTRIIAETGRRIRLGKTPAEKLTNAEVKTVLETAIEVLKEALVHEGRVEIQDFAVIEVRRETVTSVIPPIKTEDTQVVQAREERTRWSIRPANKIKKVVRTKDTK